MSSSSSSDSSAHEHRTFDDSTAEVVGRAEGTPDDRQVFHSKEDVAGLITVKAKDQLIDCYVCGRRKTPFVPAYYCRICTAIWFMVGEECQRESTKVWHGSEQLTPLEIERIHWNLEHTDLYTDWRAFNKYIESEKPDLVEQIPTGVRV